MCGRPPDPGAPCSFPRAMGSVVTHPVTNLSQPSRLKQVWHTSQHIPFRKTASDFGRNKDMLYIMPLKDRAIMCESTADPCLAPVTSVLIFSVIKMLLYFRALYPRFDAFSQDQLLEATYRTENSAEPRAVGSVSSTPKTRMKCALDAK